MVASVKDGATALCIYPCGKVLVMDHMKSGGISIPGGSIEDGETPLQAFYREMKEELDLDKDDIQLIRTERIIHDSLGGIVEYRHVIKPGFTYRNSEPEKHRWILPMDVELLLNGSYTFTEVALDAIRSVHQGKYRNLV